MQTIAIDDPGVCQPVCRADELCSKTAERIDVLCGAEITEEPGNIVLDGGSPSGDAAFAKLHWPLVLFHTKKSAVPQILSITDRAFTVSDV